MTLTQLGADLREFVGLPRPPPLHPRRRGASCVRSRGPKLPPGGLTLTTQKDSGETTAARPRLACRCWAVARRAEDHRRARTACRGRPRQTPPGNREPATRRDDGRRGDSGVPAELDRRRGHGHAGAPRPARPLPRSGRWSRSPSPTSCRDAGRPRPGSPNESRSTSSAARARRLRRPSLRRLRSRASRPRPSSCRTRFRVGTGWPASPAAPPSPASPTTCGDPLLDAPTLPHAAAPVAASTPTPMRSTTTTACRSNSSARARPRGTRHGTRSPPRPTNSLPQPCLWPTLKLGALPSASSALNPGGAFGSSKHWPAANTSPPARARTHRERPRPRRCRPLPAPPSAPSG